jgi:hypothetical protein
MCYKYKKKYGEYPCFFKVIAFISEVFILNPMYDIFQYRKDDPFINDFLVIVL